MTVPRWPWADSHLNSDWPWLRNVSTSAPLAKGENYWITAGNTHDLDEILSHYDEDFKISSPVIVQLQADPTEILRGKSAVTA
jgi:hypothetical protein